jgi:hypothetical protein
LIERGINLEAVAGPEVSETALHFASTFECARLLFEAGAKVVTPTELFIRACGWIQAGRVDVKADAVAFAERLIACGLDPIRSPIFAAIDSGEPRLVEAVIRAGSDLREFPGKGSPLEYARKGGNEEIIRIIAALT